MELFLLTMLAISDNKVFDHHFLKFIPKFSLGDDDVATGNCDVSIIQAGCEISIIFSSIFMANNFFVI